MAEVIPFEDRYVAIPIAGCWLWTSHTTPLGYGRYYPPGQKGRHGKAVYAHRHSAALAFGPLAPGVCVLHRCDTPACVNPHHLQLGSKKDNTRDMVSKGRDRFIGERSPACKLTTAQVLEIRQHNESCVVAAKKYGVSRSTITAIRRRTTRVTEQGV